MTGPDNIPNNVNTLIGNTVTPNTLITLVGPKTRQKLEGLSKIITEDRVHEKWILARMRFIYEGKGDKCDIKPYRPVHPRSYADHQKANESMGSRQQDAWTATKYFSF